jgi:hypothetical protein
MFQKIINWLRNKQKENLIQVYSHPRSGTHLLATFLGLNFYPKKALGKMNVEWGHWSNRKIDKSGNPYQKLFGSHMLAPELRNDFPIVYIYRNPYAVAYSVWKTDNFIHPKHKEISFSVFLRLNLDWSGSPYHKSEEKWNIIQHWNNHVEGWLNLASRKKHILIIRYEDLISKPDLVFDLINEKFFNAKKIKPQEIKFPNEAVGLLPNEANNFAWKNIFTKEDLDYFDSVVNKTLLNGERLSFLLKKPSTTSEKPINPKCEHENLLDCLT